LLRAGYALAVAWILATALARPPTLLGDAGEYVLMTESFARHASPDARPTDVTSLIEKLRGERLGLKLKQLLAAFVPNAAGRRYCYHFWGYSLATLPAKILLHVVGLTDLKAGQLTNAFVLLFALHQALFVAPFGRVARSTLALLTLFSPIAWYLLWTHPETACASAVLLALVWSAAGRPHAAILAAAAAAMQNPPILFLVAALWARAWVPGLRDWHDAPRALARRVLIASLAALPAAAPPLFYLVTLGTPSPLVQVATDPGLLSLRRATELFFDLNLGMLPYLPATVLLFGVATLVQLFARRTALAAFERCALLLVMALSCTVTQNWNSGAAGVSRYAVWLLPLLFMGLAEFVEAGVTAGSRTRNAIIAVAALAVVSQAAGLYARGGLVQGDDSLTHSYAARLVLRHAPSLYNPTPHIFVSRTQHQALAPEFALYVDESGRCRKAFARPKDAARLISACGVLPPSREAYFAQTTRRKLYQYVDY
jgi:hypothetical protein